MLKDKLLQATLKSEEIEILGEKAIVKEMTAGESAKYQNSLYKIVGDKVIYQTDIATIKLVALTLYDTDGALVFGAKDIEQVKALPACVVEQIYKVSAKLNGLNKRKN